MINQILSSFLESEDCVSFYQNERFCGTRSINLILIYYNLKFYGEIQLSIPTEAHSRTLAKRKICVVRSTAFVFLCEPVWVELVRFWEVRWIKVDT